MASRATTHGFGQLRPGARTGLLTHRPSHALNEQLGIGLSDAMAYSPEPNTLVIPLRQSCLEIAGREVAIEESSGGTAALRK
ncbi:MAG: hypothetical protein IH939_14960 [Acidobacteria bacterium]|nr:hypothetical protein [Acidobacteriota bacterium]